MPDNDPLTLVPAMIAAIDPGPRLIDGLLLRDLYLLAGDPATAASIEAGYRMVDIQLLTNLATLIGAVETAEFFRITQDVGPRLIDGTPWKDLAEMASGEEPPDENPPEPDPEPDPEPEPEPEPEPDPEA